MAPRTQIKWNLQDILYRRRILKVTEFRDLMKKHGLPMSYSNAYTLARGNPQKIAMKKLHVICKALGCSVGDLLTIEEAGPSKRNRRSS
ncbi:MAG TPA: hypothetical protein DCP92_10260 [Nitrospiraceae bacterium]|jgi:DNA-binding Xre family transcriptional regulator|nr:hypothetical protein [Nitrospiraceae bacterium]